MITDLPDFIERPADFLRETPIRENRIRGIRKFIKRYLQDRHPDILIPEDKKAVAAEVVLAIVENHERYALGRIHGEVRNAIQTICDPHANIHKQTLEPGERDFSHHGQYAPRRHRRNIMAVR